MKIIFKICTGSMLVYPDFVDKTEACKITEFAGEFGELMDFIAALPFQTKGRMLIIYDDREKSSRRIAVIRMQKFATGFCVSPGSEETVSYAQSKSGCAFPNKVMTDLSANINMKISTKTESGAIDKLSFDVKTDPRITYPSYKSFDEFIDVDRLRSLDGYITQRIKRHLKTRDDLKFYTGPYRLEKCAPARPGSRMIYLARSEKPDRYFDLDKTELWHPTVYANEFALLMDFIGTLPFQATGRMLIMYDDAPRSVPAHRDHIETGICHEFIWFRPNLKKPFYMLNPNTNEKQYVESYSAWFDSVNQYHGSDAVEGLSYSIRVDGKFTGEFRAKIPQPEINLASTPSYWASF